MVRKIAIDWDESELRFVVAQCSGSSVKVTEAAVVDVENGDVMETLRKAMLDRGLSRTDALIAIGRGKAELRELQLPPVPDEELPDMVRFQAIRTFASAGESATVDYLVTGKTEEATSLIAAAVGPAKLSEIHEICEASDLHVKRIALRPLAAAALYLINQNQPTTLGETVLIDLLSDDAEIVVARNGKVIFVRTVRMPRSSAGRPVALAGELRRSLVACGATGAPDRVVLWGRESVHRDDMEKIAEASGSNVDVVDPFALVDVERGAKGTLPEHTGRLAPLVGLLASDETAGARLIDFLNPRRRAEEKSDTLQKSLLIGVPIAAVLLLAFLAYRQISGLDKQIAELNKRQSELVEPVKEADGYRARTEEADKFLDGGVNWLNEMRRLAQAMPPAEEMIVRSLTGTVGRAGGGTLQLSVGVTQSDIIDDFEDALRDENHRVVSDGAKADQRARDAYRWGTTADISVSSSAIRNARYKGMLAADSGSPAPAVLTDDASESSAADTPEKADPEPSTTKKDSAEPPAATDETESPPEQAEPPAATDETKSPPDQAESPPDQAESPPDQAESPPDTTADEPAAEPLESSSDDDPEQPSAEPNSKADSEVQA